MRRVVRKPSIFGTIDLADQLGMQFNLPLDQIAEKFSLPEAKDASARNPMMMHGKRVERMFESVIASLGYAEMITQEDSGVTSYNGDPVQSPDYFVALKSGERYLVEVKNKYVRNFSDKIKLEAAYLMRLKRYAALKGYPLLLAVYWPPLSYWTINKISDIEREDGSIALDFADALKVSVTAEFGDRMVATVPPLVARLHADPAKPSGVSPNGVAHFVSSGMTLHADGRDIADEREKQIAMYFIFHSRWHNPKPRAVTSEGRVDYIEFVSEPEEDDGSGHPFSMLGTFAGMISSYFNWLTVADEKIIRLTPAQQPGELALGIGDNYQGKVLRMWYFEIQPNYQPLKRMTVPMPEA
jgi:hypothetical protein